MGFEQALENSIFSGQSEKTFIDKALDKEDIDRLRDLIKKDVLTRQDLLEILNLISGKELKLWNLGEWDRYALTKFFVLIREFVVFEERLWDYKDDLGKKQNVCKNCKSYLEVNGNNKLRKCICSNPEPSLILSPRSIQIFDNIMRTVEHDIKFLVDLYVNIGRSSLSFKGTAFLELIKQKFEFAYPQTGSSTPIGEEKKKSWWR